MTTTIIVTDIFGRTEHVEKFAEHFKNSIIIDPYNGENLHFSSEQYAYEHFNSVCGLKKYTDTVFDTLSTVRGRVSAVGFSMGASALWNNTGRVANLDRAVCFYGSRIRESLDIAPKCAVLAVFPAFEPSFDVDSVVLALSEIPNVEVEKTKYLHGFMNPLSANFSADGYFEYLHRLK